MKTQFIIQDASGLYYCEFESAEYNCSIFASDILDAKTFDTKKALKTFVRDNLNDVFCIIVEVYI